jgi:hypothetical protein
MTPGYQYSVNNYGGFMFIIRMGHRRSATQQWTEPRMYACVFVTSCESATMTPPGRSGTMLPINFSACQIRCGSLCNVAVPLRRADIPGPRSGGREMKDFFQRTRTHIYIYIGLGRLLSRSCLNCLLLPVPNHHLTCRLGGHGGVAALARVWSTYNKDKMCTIPP